MSKLGNKVDNINEITNAGNNVPDGFIPPEIQKHLQSIQQNISSNAGMPASASKPAEDAPVKNVPTIHPVLRQLKADLGILKEKFEDVIVGDHKWSMSVLTQDDVSLALFMASKVSYDAMDFRIKQNVAIISLAIKLIDDVPVPEVMGIDSNLKPDEKRRLGAHSLFEFLLSEAKTELGSKLYDAYVQNVDKKNEVSSMLDPQNKTKLTFTCPIESCDNIEVIDIDNNIKPENYPLMFCKHHGVEMTLVNKEVFDKNNPLS